MPDLPEQTSAVDYAGIIDTLAQVNAQPLWDRYMRITSREPRASEAPLRWRWRDMHPLMERAVREVSMDDAERRVLLLTHPAFGGRFITTGNLQAGLQILEPGEHARAHRHTLSALRFVMAGDGAATLVNGKRCPMEEGDLILTPSWTWHEHVNEGTQRVVWFDGLDVPLGHYLDTVFLEFGPVRDLPDDLSSVPDAVFEEGGPLPAKALPAAGYSPQFRYSWQSACRALDQLPARADGAKLMRYVNPVNKGAVMPTIDCYLLDLPAGVATAAQRSTSSAVCVVAHGAGKSQVGAETIEWSKGDVFTLPHWQWASHHANEHARIFMMTDRELLERTGYLREETAQPAF